jgi:triosephosphate isomerase
MTKPFKVVGNWKMNKTIQEALDFAQALPPLFHSNYLAVPYTCIQPLTSLDIPMLQIGAQNLYPQREGAYTGEISPVMLKEAGADFVILGHSERRTLFNESNLFVNKKVKAALNQDLHSIICIGESAIERDQKKTHQVLKAQLFESLHEIEPALLSNITLAYEPIWAIGTGEPATAQAAQEVHFQIRKIIEEKWGAAEAQKIYILYGGSVSEDSVLELAKQPDIDGVLIGGASLHVEKYTKIIELVGGPNT